MNAGGGATAGASTAFDERQAATLIEHGESHWWFRAKASWVSSSLAKGPGGPAAVLVDVGAGAGGVTRQLAWQGSRVVVEPSEALVPSSAILSFVRAGAERLPFPDSSIEALCLLDVIEHLHDPVAALREAARALRPDGTLVVTVPGHAWLWSDADVALGHQRRYTVGLLRAQLAEAGLRPQRVHHIFSWLVPPTYLVRKLGRRSAEEQMGLDMGGGVVDRAARLLTRFEQLLARILPMPFGTSVLAVAKPAR